MGRKIYDSLTFDDVLLKPASSSILPKNVNTKTLLTKTVSLEIPIISAAMDTVTESQMAIAMAQNGGIGSIHKNMKIEEQMNEVKKVKKFESGIVVNPVTISKDKKLKDALDLMLKNKISGIPVVEKNNKLVGILTNRDVRFFSNSEIKVEDLMTKKNLQTVRENVDMKKAKEILHKFRIEKLIVVDKDYKCVGLITVKDIEKARKYPNACKDTKGRLRVAAAVDAGEKGIERAQGLIDVDTDVIIVDTAHGHSKNVIDTVKKIKKKSNYTQVIAGNIATKEGAKALIDEGADAVKVGIGPGSICTTRMVAGVGVPQLTAIMEVAEVTKKRNIPLIADGGIKYSGDIAKAVAAGADTIMIGSLLAGTDESPGDVYLYQGRSYKSYRGMGSISAMLKGSAERYFQDSNSDVQKLIPEGVEGQVPYKGPVNIILNQLIGGLRSSMGYTGNENIKKMKINSEFIKITRSGLKESHVHDVTITKESPNYKPEGTN
ncbi:MAG: IMP dehydrogenase [Alphaproteobacteria bacterium]|nr:IMP dehydrogenase [Alphaproteobacteria bacterium]|tara:strand:+ start:45 stop:1517 length:1473 start_codon:yes stop_codon:yes gene_type:complete